MNNDEKLRFIADLVDCIETAIKAGDWKVDGVCDPEALLEGARFMLKKNGYKQDDRFIEVA